MRGFFKGFGLLAFSMVVTVVLLYTVSRLMPFPEEDARALALIEAPHTLAGRNGFAALWSLNHDIPIAEAERLLAAEVVRFEGRPAWPGEGGVPEYASVLDGYPSLDADGKDPALCTVRAGDCLRHVRAQRGALDAVMASRTTLASRVAGLDVYDHFRNPFPSRLDTPFPPYQPLISDLTTHAHAFARGDREAGLRGVCRSGSIARKLVASGDNLIGSVVGTALMDGAARLFVEMLAELPADQPLPLECRTVFDADGALAAGICPAMRGEGRFMLGGFRPLDALQPGVQRVVGGVFLDEQRTRALAARRFAWFCGQEAAALIGADVPLASRAPLSGGWSFACVSNVTGCVLDNIAAPPLAGYAERLQDTEARLRVVTAWRALRAPGNDARPLAERLEAWQARHPEVRRIRVSAGGDGLEIDLFDDRQGRVFALPLAAGMPGPRTP